MNFGAIGPIAIHFPERVETNDHLRELYPNWDIDLIYEKTGIGARHIAAEGETAADLGVAAAQKLFHEKDIDPNSIDFLLLCTQTPDYPLPTTACLMQDRLGLPTSVGALDFNLGCSGFVYGLAHAEGLIRASMAKRVLLVTAETYSKYIDDADRSLRTIFGDAAAATLIEAQPEQSLDAFQFGTDGSGANTLLVRNRGARDPADEIQPRHRHRWKSDLYMDGPSLINFTVAAIPELVEDVLNAGDLKAEDVDLYLFHQATHKMLEQLRMRLKTDEVKMPIVLDHCGNTVSSTIPIVIDHLRGNGRIAKGTVSMLVGFGVGWSWAGCTWKEIQS